MLKCCLVGRGSVSGLVLFFLFARTQANNARCGYNTVGFPALYGPATFLNAKCFGELQGGSGKQIRK